MVSQRFSSACFFEWSTPNCVESFRSTTPAPTQVTTPALTKAPAAIRRPDATPVPTPEPTLDPDTLFGEVIGFNEDKGFGFIRPSDSDGDKKNDLFFHVKSLIDGPGSVKKKDLVVHFHLSS